MNMHHADPQTLRALQQMREAMNQQPGPPPDVIGRATGGDQAAENRHGRERSPFDLQRNVAANAANTRQVGHHDR